MQWYEGGVGEAIAAAKAARALFVVFVAGPAGEEGSAELEAVLQNQEVATAFGGQVCIKLEAGSPTCTQFSAIYPVLLLPCVFFIDSATGVDIEITGGATLNKESLLASLNRATNLPAGTTALPAESPAVSTPTAETKIPAVASPVAVATPAVVAAPAAEPVEGGSAAVEPAAAAAGGSAGQQLEARVERAKQLMEERRLERERQEKEKEKTEEQRRREAGRALLEQKRAAEEREVKEAALSRRADKEEAARAKAAVQAAIEQDRQDRKEKYDAERAEATKRRAERERALLAEKQQQAELAAAARATVARYKLQCRALCCTCGDRLQFRLPDGSCQTHQFPATAALAEVYSWVGSSLQQPGASLSTSFPRRQLDTEERSSSLQQLGLAPSATLLVLPSTGLASQDGGLLSFLWLLLSPLTALWALLSGFLGSFTGSGSAAPTAAGGAGRGAQQGGMGRIRSSEGSDDENNTWNGNSTQQM